MELQVLVVQVAAQVHQEVREHQVLVLQELKVHKVQQDLKVLKEQLEHKEQ